MAKSVGLFFGLIDLFNTSDWSRGQMIDLIGHEIDCHKTLSKSEQVKSSLKFLRLSEALGAAIKLQRAVDEVAFGSEASRCVKVIRATLGDIEALSDIATTLMHSATWDDFSSQAERDARLVTAIGWFVIASGARTFFPTLRVAKPDAPLLAGYELAARLRAIKSLTPYLSTAIAEEDQPIGYGPRYSRDEIDACGLSLTVVGTSASFQFTAGVTEAPILEAGVVAMKVARRFPAFERECDALIEQPTSLLMLNMLIEALESQDIADASEEIEGLVMVGAQLGDRKCLLRSAGYAVRRGYHDADRELLRYALGALAISSGARHVEQTEDLQRSIAMAGKYLLQSFSDTDAATVAAETKATVEEKRDPDAYQDFFGDPVPDQAQIRLAEKALEIRSASLGLAPEREFVRVIAQRTDTSIADRDIKTALKNFDILSQPLPLATMPGNLAAWRDGLLSEFPHASSAIDAIYSDLFARQSGNKRSFHIRPTLLVGEPGCGKSRLARRLAETADIAFKSFPCGGVADGHFGGVSRGWSSALPSVPLEFIRATKTPNPVLLLDEVEKSGTSRHNGNIIDSLLGMLELETGKAWIDPFLQAPVDLSQVNWLFTANTLDPLPAPFKDRVRIIEVPKPSLDHLPQLAASVLRDLNQSSWHQPLDQDELAAVASAWGPSRSVRALRRLVEGILRAREQAAMRH